jgi:hypothetical protein
VLEDIRAVKVEEEWKDLKSGDVAVISNETLCIGMIAETNNDTMDFIVLVGSEPGRSYASFPIQEDRGPVSKKTLNTYGERLCGKPAVRRATPQEAAEAFDALAKRERDKIIK